MYHIGVDLHNLRRMALSDVANVILSYAKNLQVQQCPFIAHRKLFHANADIVKRGSGEKSRSFAVEKSLIPHRMIRCLLPAIAVCIYDEDAFFPFPSVSTVRKYSPEVHARQTEQNRNAALKAEAPNASPGYRDCIR
ncbi:MAG: hypothetical protein BWY58_00081 [Chloroflexi bacterium ADurb.Bin344]|nr:MAG: hypothetical protein BWY58_00081 [Chloroflexi bacterium ADurb.Bin344]